MYFLIPLLPLKLTEAVIVHEWIPYFRLDVNGIYLLVLEADRLSVKGKGIVQSKMSLNNLLERKISQNLV